MPNEHTIAENLQRLVDAKTAIGNAITAKGGTVAQGDGLEEFPTAINGISTGVDTSSDTVTAATLKSGYTAHNAAGQPITGTMLSQPTTVTAATLGDGETAYNASGELITGTMQGGLEMNVKFTADRKTIPDYMFYNNHGSGSSNSSYSLKEVVIGDGITSIGRYAFYQCNYITSIIIPNSVTSIGDWAFASCSKLTSITIPDGVTSISGSTFNSSTGLTSIAIPNSVTTIYNKAFAYCYSLTDVTIGNGITSIDSSAFQSCSNLRTITINKPSGSVSGAPWGATNATVVWTG